MNQIARYIMRYRFLTIIQIYIPVMRIFIGWIAETRRISSVAHSVNFNSSFHCNCLFTGILKYNTNDIISILPYCWIGCQAHSQCYCTPFHFRFVTLLNKAFYYFYTSWDEVERLFLEFISMYGNFTSLWTEDVTPPFSSVWTTTCPVRGYRGLRS
jgi:hypothetical protein